MAIYGTGVVGPALFGSSASAPPCCCDELDGYRGLDRGSWGQKLRMMRQCTETQLDGKEGEKPAAIRCRMK